MEFLSSAFEGRALLFGDDTDFTIDGLTSNRNLLKNLNGEDAVENIGFIEPLLPNTTISSASFLDDQCLDKTIANDDKFAAAKQTKGNMFSADNSVLPSPKRAKTGDLQPPIPTCQVYGCNKDLSSSKDYHKRHKVCDLHSKTAVVVVNGIRQRFCQQCSRFHVLAEFDEGKRSCRKRLAGHNERRRKPQFNAHFRDTSKALIFSRILGLQSNYPTHLKLEEQPFPRLSQSLPKTVLRFHGMGKQYPSKNCLNSPSELYASSASGCALSLLSGNDHFNLSTPQSCSSNGYGVGVASKTPQGAKTVNLLELSLHLQRVEQQKNYGQIKMESDDLFDSAIV